MPFVLILFGAILFVAAVQNNQAALWALVKNDFSGKDSFAVWIIAIIAIGSLGYIKSLRTLSISIMTLLLLVLVISNKGVFSQLQQFVQGADASGGSTFIDPQTGEAESVALTSLTPVQQVTNNLTSIAP